MLNSDFHDIHLFPILRRYLFVFFFPVVGNYSSVYSDDHNFVVQRVIADLWNLALPSFAQIRYLERWVKVSGHVRLCLLICIFFVLVLYQQVASAVGTFGRVLECWDREIREHVAIKVVKSTTKYRDAARIEIDVLQRLAENDKGDSQ